MEQEAPLHEDEARPPRRSAEDRLAARATRFELAALLRLLFRRDYGWETISFEGARELGPSAGLVHSIRFEGASPRRAIIRLNMGLLGPNGGLPSYFHRFATTLMDPRPFLAFVRFFDDVLLRNYAYLTCPSEGAAASSGLPVAYRATAGFASAPRLHWLFRSVFPELPVTVSPFSFKAERPDAGARFGASSLGGGAIMGPAYQVVEQGFVVRLFAEEELDEAGRPWEEIAARRFAERIAPVLVRFDAKLQVCIRFDSFRTGAALAATSQMGTRRIRTPEGGPWEVVIFGPMR